jgi:hypothetical protein
MMLVDAPASRPTPTLRFFVRAEEPGDIECRWVDRENESGSASARVTVSG